MTKMKPMRCPVCGSEEDKVLETRTTENGMALRRRRECMKCGYRFTSYERVEERPIVVRKKDGSIQNFDPEKIRRSIGICTDKRNIDPDVLNDVIQKVEQEIKVHLGPEHEVTSAEIGEEILRQLYKVDAVAYVRFASVYRGFNTVEQFIKEIDNLKK